MQIFNQKNSSVLQTSKHAFARSLDLFLQTRPSLERKSLLYGNNFNTDDSQISKLMNHRMRVGI